MRRGFFYFRLTNSGNLIGEFFNDANNSTIRTESADRNNDGNTFNGEYRSSWREENSFDGMNLNIRISPNNNRIFELTWFETNINEPSFQGQAMILEENLLSGYYFAL
ncbi:hypothetical protein J3D55_003746 [Chryseobacterium ginsenosidimutans]|uniref:hypothetical protein n=1 Tax=Chryseobacterium ginsenosidimutans TaxID=687846 RepID=UPI0021695268|nr:hypothetical protein [Chryseobacterium ginsenosidimutans]MCS3870830.1 hypothetical protein [Chryseobacterium ginsenosidimutans]